MIEDKQSPLLQDIWEPIRCSNVLVDSKRETIAEIWPESQFSPFVCLSPSVFCETLCRAEIPYNTHGEMLAWFPSEHVMLVAKSFPLGGNRTPCQSMPYTDKLEHTKVKHRPQKTKHLTWWCSAIQPRAVLKAWYAVWSMYNSALCIMWVVNSSATWANTSCPQLHSLSDF